MKISTILVSGALLIGASASAQDNLISKANEGTNGDKGAMATNGWEAWKCPFSFDPIEEEYTFDAPEQLTWDASGPGGNNVRWESKGSAVTYNGSAYNGRVAFIRWDNGGIHNLWYAFPVEITTPGIYEFSMLGGEWSNTSADSDNSLLTTDGSQSAVLVGFSEKIGPEGIKWEEATTDEEKAISLLGVPGAGQGKIFTFEKTPNDQAALQKCVAEFDAPKAGKYYVEIAGSHSITVMTEFSLVFKKAFSAVEDIEAADVVETAFYGLDGTRVAAPAKGSLVIEKSILSNGEVKVAKRIIR